MTPKIHVASRVLGCQIRLFREHVSHSPPVLMAKCFSAGTWQHYRLPPFFLPPPWRSNQLSRRSIRNRQCDLRLPIRNAPGTAPSAACRRKVRGGMPSTRAASASPMERRLSSGERIICPPGLWPALPVVSCILGLLRQQSLKAVCESRNGRNGSLRYPLGNRSFALSPSGYELFCGWVFAHPAACFFMAAPAACHLCMSSTLLRQYHCVFDQWPLWLRWPSWPFKRVLCLCSPVLLCALVT
jgi:hypothetical protein